MRGRCCFLKVKRCGEQRAGQTPFQYKLYQSQHECDLVFKILSRKAVADRSNALGAKRVGRGCGLKKKPLLREKCAARAEEVSLSASASRRSQPLLIISFFFTLEPMLRVVNTVQGRGAIRMNGDRSCIGAESIEGKKQPLGSSVGSFGTSKVAPFFQLPPAICRIAQSSALLPFRSLAHSASFV